MEMKSEPQVDFNPDNTREINDREDLACLGEFPYTRGIYLNMYGGRLWTMRQNRSWFRADILTR